MKKAKRGEIWLLNLNAITNSKQQGMRHVFIISTLAYNQFGICVIYTTTQASNQTHFACFKID